MPRDVYPGAPLIHSERVSKLQAVKSPRNPAGPFADLTWTQQRAAEQWLHKFCARWGNDLPSWRRAILTGVAKRLAKNPPAAGWGLRMHRARGPRALAERCRRDGSEHPIFNALRIGAWKRAGKPVLSASQTALT